MHTCVTNYVYITNLYGPMAAGAHLNHVRHELYVHTSHKMYVYMSHKFICDNGYACASQLYESRTVHRYASRSVHTSTICTAARAHLNHVSHEPNLYTSHKLYVHMSHEIYLRHQLLWANGCSCIYLMYHDAVGDSCVHIVHMGWLCLVESIKV